MRQTVEVTLITPSVSIDIQLAKQQKVSFDVSFGVADSIEVTTASATPVVIRANAMQ